MSAISTSHGVAVAGCHLAPGGQASQAAAAAPLGGVDPSEVGSRKLPELVAGAMQQQRLLSVAPVGVTEEALAGIIRDSLENG
jgi:hypothetical protein